VKKKIGQRKTNPRGRGKKRAKKKIKKTNLSDSKKEELYVTRKKKIESYYIWHGTIYLYLLYLYYLKKIKNVSVVRNNEKIAKKTLKQKKRSIQFTSVVRENLILISIFPRGRAAPSIPARAMKHQPKKKNKIKQRDKLDWSSQN
jgi:hypothetical protein